MKPEETVPSDRERRSWDPTQNSRARVPILCLSGHDYSRTRRETTVPPRPLPVSEAQGETPTKVPPTFLVPVTCPTPGQIPVLRLPVDVVTSVPLSSYTLNGTSQGRVSRRRQVGLIYWSPWFPHRLRESCFRSLSFVADKKNLREARG